MVIFGGNKLIAVVRYDDLKTSRAFSHACIEGGVKLIEVITIQKGSFELIKELSNIKGMNIGAGTVLSMEAAELAVDAGAKFIVSPHTDAEIIRFTKSNGLISIAGAVTSSEIVKANKLGADFVKIFPASSFGPGYVKAVKQALPFVDILVTGGINTGNALDYISAGASLLGVVSAFTGDGSSFERKTVINKSKNFISLLNNAG